MIASRVRSTGRLYDPSHFNESSTFVVPPTHAALALYDPTKFNKGPFETTPQQLLAATVAPGGATTGLSPSISWTSLEFSPDDRFIALSTSDRGVLLVDAFFPQRELALLNVHPIDPAQPTTVSFSPCGRFLCVGGSDGHVWAYDLLGEPGLFWGAPGEGRIELGKLQGDGQREDFFAFAVELLVSLRLCRHPSYSRNALAYHTQLHSLHCLMHLDVGYLLLLF